MRGLERKDRPILTGYQLFHDYIRPHMALNGQTPSEKAWITIKGKDKWMTIIQNARQAVIEHRSKTEPPVSCLLFCLETAFQDGHWLQKSSIRTERSIHVKSARQDMRSHEPLVIVRISAKATMLAH